MMRSHASGHVAIRTYREEEIRYKSDRKQLTRASRILAAKLKSQQTYCEAAQPRLPPCRGRLRQINAAELIWVVESP